MKIGVFFGVAIIAIFIAGWCLNIMKMAQLDFKSPYKAEVVRLVGVVPLVGGVVGYIDIDDGE